MDPNPKESKPADQVYRKKKSTRGIVFGIVLLTVVLAGAWFIFSADGQKQDLVQSANPFKMFQQEKVSPQSLQQPEKEVEEDLPIESITTGEEDSSSIEATVPAERNLQIGSTENLPPQEQCILLSSELEQFFSHIDSNDYIKQFNLNQSSQDYFNQLATKLFANPPVVIRESDDLYTILTNMAHFFRIIGRDNILLIKTILDRERDEVEDVAAELYQWTIGNQCASGESFKMEAPLEKVYEYAGFFLNTMGGRSYLFRRDSRSRLLVHYYSILTIDQANKEKLNRHGLDIQEQIPKLIREIEATNQLIYKEDYIDTLHELQEEVLAGSD